LDSELTVEQLFDLLDGELRVQECGGDQCALEKALLAALGEEAAEIGWAGRGEGQRTYGMTSC